MLFSEIFEEWMARLPLFSGVDGPIFVFLPCSFPKRGFLSPPSLADSSTLCESDFLLRILPALTKDCVFF